MTAVERLLHGYSRRVPEQREKAERFRDLHHASEILVLPNAWDVASARIFAASPRCRAVATSSAAVANMLGYADGERIPRAEMLEWVGRIVRAVDLPVTADLEAGYGDAAATARGAIDAGAIGLNLEDGAPGERRLVPTEEHAVRVAAVREVGEAAGVPLVINARTDGYLIGHGDFADTVARGNAYLAAGADCVFVPGVRDSDLIGRLVAQIAGPVSLLAGPGTPPAPELERLGVARVSVGSGPMRAAAGLVARIAEELLDRGTYAAMLDGALASAELNRLVDRTPR